MTCRLCLFVVTSALFGTAFAYDAEDKVIAVQGSMPVILTVPHDGTEALGWLSPRSKGVTVRDLGTQRLAERTADQIEKQAGTRPYLVIAKFSRRYLDANRAEKDAMESADALPAYRAYHRHIARFIAEASQRFPNGAVLIDVHGQGAEPDTIFRGTRNGLTVSSLIGRHGNAAIQGPDSILGVLQGKGHHVFPKGESENLQEDKRFNGGYTVFSYGSNTTRGIDAIQIEFGRRSRDNPRMAEDLSDAILVFARKFLAAPK